MAPWVKDLVSLQQLGLLFFFFFLFFYYSDEFITSIVI